MSSILSALNLDSIPEFSLGTAALLIFGAIASLAVLRGLLRILWGTTILCLAGLASFYAWQHAHSLALQWFKQEPSWFPIALPLLTFLASFFLLRAIGRFVARPLGEPNAEIAEKNRRSPIRWVITLFLSLIPTCLIWFAGATLLRHAGSVAEVKTYAENLAKEPVSKQTAYLAKLKNDIEAAIPSDWFSKVDPLTSELRLTLAKLISSADDPAPKAVAVLEEPEMKALILSDPELRQLARDGRYSDILRDPRLDRMLENDNLREVLQDLDL
ncbi:hypothetical protein ACFQY0_16930 [Haloferula chungangensis]|uniref:Uncharacterized protein n=1 Tax=Haloferula chungangensis TaxID=1048331 RepID=A0ABW2L8Z9_9BACT